METRKHLAAEKKRCGSHNCAQAILCTYADKVGIDEETAKNIANSFGAEEHGHLRRLWHMGASLDARGREGDLYHRVH